MLGWGRSRQFAPRLGAARRPTTTSLRTAPRRSAPGRAGGVEPQHPVTNRLETDTAESRRRKSSLAPASSGPGSRDGWTASGLATSPLCSHLEAPESLGLSTPLFYPCPSRLGLGSDHGCVNRQPLNATVRLPGLILSSFVCYFHARKGAEATLPAQKGTRFPSEHPQDRLGHAPEIIPDAAALLQMKGFHHVFHALLYTTGVTKWQA